MQSLALKKISKQLSRGKEQKIRVHELERASDQKGKREFLRPLTAGGGR